MNKQHFKPEFSVIRQNEANAKFFVASGEFTNAPAQITSPAASQYDHSTDGSDDLYF